MAKYHSRGGVTPSSVELRYSAFKFALIWLSLLATFFVGYFWVYPHLISDDDSCVTHWPDLSVFTTGDQITDQRIFWAIRADRSENLAQAQDLVTQIWENRSTQNITGSGKELWDEAVQAVPDNAPTTLTPLLSITQDGAILPYSPVTEVKNETWMWVQGNDNDAATLAYVRSGPHSQAVPVVSLKEGVDVPAIKNSEKNAAIAEEKPICRVQ